MKVRRSGTMTGHRDPWGALTGSWRQAGSVGEVIRGRR